MDISKENEAEESHRDQIFHESLSRIFIFENFFALSLSENEKVLSLEFSSVSMLQSFSLNITGRRDFLPKSVVVGSFSRLSHFCNLVASVAFKKRKFREKL